MKTWQRILVVTVLLITAALVGLTRLAQTQRDNSLSVSNLKTISLAWTMYADDYDDKFPDLSDAQTMKTALAAYLNKDASKAERFFVHPNTGRPYQPNSSLSFKKRQGFNYPSQIVVVYEDAPARDGTRGVLFGDGHVDRVNEARWRELKKTSNIL
jgi:prepilin-type processing-associated H-X9-DG protein